MVLHLRLPMVRPTRRAFQFAFPVVIVVLVVQALVGTEPQALAWSFAASIASLVTLAYCLRPGLFERFPLSTFALLGFGTVMLALPLVAQSASGRSLLYNLHDPEETFGWTLATLALLVTAHALYVQLSLFNAPGRWLAQRVFAPLGLFRTPSTVELWALGTIGFVATAFSQVILAGQIEYGDVQGKALAGFVDFINFPFLIPFMGMFAGRKLKTSRVSLILLPLYLLLVIVLSLAINKRAAFANLGFTIF